LNSGSLAELKEFDEASFKNHPDIFSVIISPVSYLKSHPVREHPSG